MTESDLDEKVYEMWEQVMHFEIALSLVDLGMTIDVIQEQDDQAQFSSLFIRDPIREYIGSIMKAIEKLNTNIEVNIKSVCYWRDKSHNSTFQSSSHNEP